MKQEAIMLMREIEAAAVAKHGGRAYSMVRYVGDGRLTKANWQAVLAEAAEAPHSI